MPVYKLNNKRWYFSFSINGTRVMRKIWNGEPMTTKAQAQNAEMECRQDFLKNQDRKGRYLRISDLLNEYVTNTKGNLKITTMREYDKFKRLYLTKMDDLLIWDITPNDIGAWKTEMLKMDVSANYLNRNIKIMQALLQYGSIVYNIPSNLQVALMDPVKSRVIVTENKNKYISVEQFEKMMSQYDPNINDHLYYMTLFNVLYYTGIRIGELAALTIDDIKSNYIIINKDYARVNGVDYIQTPKSSHSVRVVYMDEKTANMVHEYISRFNIDSGIVFHKEGPYLNQQKLRRILKRLSVVAGIDNTHDIRPHILRHSHASNLRSMGYDEYTISARLGNTPSVAAVTYIHGTDAEQLELVKKLRK